MNVFAQARNNLNLTPGQRAFLKLVEGFIVAGIVAALPAISQALAAQSINWSQIVRTAAATFSVAALLAVTKYLKAQNDPPLATVATTVAQAAVSDIPRWAGIPSFDVVPAVASAGAADLPAPAPPADAPVPAAVAVS
ncbi:MAG TPA: hypothetical protein VKQ30_20020 [Ktedonobacterales bacterium]|nr:hypothetical protein [Ktedonobacterales bacterium]